MVRFPKPYPPIFSSFPLLCLADPSTSFLIPFPVKMPREGVLDSSLFNLATTLVKEQVDRLNSGFRSYDPKAFASEIRKMLSSEAGKLALRQTARHHSLVTNTATFMLGPLDVPIKERRVAQRREKDVITQATTAEDVDDLESDNKNEATKRVEELEALLPDEGQNMNFWEYVYDGDEEKGFGRTIENIFYSAFLARDGHSGLAVDGTSPQIMRTTAPLAQDYIDRIATKHQCVVQFDYTSWMQLREAFGDRTYLPAPTAEIVNEAAAPSKKKATQGGAKAEKKATPAKKNVSASQASVTSPNSKKRSRAQEVEEDDDSEVGETQIEDTPAERLPSAKRKAL